MSATVPDEPPGRPSRFQRRAVWAVITLCILSALTEVNAWPFTSWRLFSVVRTESEVHYEIFVVAAGAAEFTLVDLRRAGTEFRDVEHIIRDTVDASDDDQRSVCLALADVAEQFSGPVVAARVDRVVVHLDSTPEVTDREVVLSCQR